MKKVLAIVFLGSLVMSCAKKETATESNTMLEEPKSEITMDSAATQVKMETTAPKEAMKDTVSKK